MNTKLDTRQSENHAALSMIGSAANTTLDSILSSSDSTTAKLYEDRNIHLSDGGIIAFNSSGVLSFTQNLNLLVNSRIAGGSPLTISLGSASQTFANLSMLYAVVNRTLGTATVTLVNNATGLPAVNSTNNEVFLIAKRFDSADGTVCIYLRDGFSLSAGQSARLYNDGSSGANTALSNLSGTAVNADIIPALNNTVGLGTSTLAWDSVWAENFGIKGATSGNVQISASPTTTSYSLVLPAAQSSGTGFLKNDGAGNLSWANPGIKNVVTETTTYAATSNDNVILADATSGAFTITLPSPSANSGQELYIKKIDSTTNIVTVAGTIDSITNTELFSQKDMLHIISNGTDWESVDDKLRYIEFVNTAPVNVRVASTANINVTTGVGANTGDTFNGVVLALNDLILLKNQTTSSENGVYKVKTGSSAMVRDTSANVFSQLNGYVAYAQLGTTAPRTSYYQVDTLTSFSSPQSWLTTGNSYSFIVPANVTVLKINAAGGAGGGGGAGGITNGGAQSGGGGGGSGAQPKTIHQKVAPGDTITVVLGLGGSGGANGSDGTNGVNGTNGGNSTISGTGWSLTFTGALGGSLSLGQNGTNGVGGAGALASYVATADLTAGGKGADALVANGSAGSNSLMATGGAVGVNNGSGGGGGGGAGIAAGGMGGQGNTGGVPGTSGLNGGTSAGGGGGGGGGNNGGGNDPGGPGGRGGDGYVMITW